MMTTLDTTTRAALRSFQKKSSTLLASRLWMTGLVFIGFVIVCLTARDALSNLYFRWSGEEEYGYGFLIIALVPFLLWRRWPSLVAQSSNSVWFGLAILTAAQLLIVLSALGESFYVAQIALIASFMGIGLVVFGARAFRLLLPIAVLLFLTLPLPFTLQAMLTIRLQLISTEIAEVIIRLFGIPVYVEGNVIDLGIYQLQVAEACSGLRYLLPMFCLSFLVAYLYKAPFWKKALLVVSAAPITIGINSFRIAVTAVLVNVFGIQMAEGFLHEFEGWIIFILGVILVGLLMLALERFRWSRIEIESARDVVTPGARAGDPFRIRVTVVAAVLICAAALGVTTSIAVANKSTPAPVRQSFADFPQQIGSWTGKPETLDAPTVNLLKATDLYSGNFIAGPRSAPVNLFVAYYESLTKNAAIHSPRVCLPGSGWEFAAFNERNFSDLVPGMSGTYNNVVIQHGDEKMLMYYWYQQRERRTANEFSMKYYLLVDNVFGNRRDGALVRLLTVIDPAAGSKARAEADARLRSFVQAMGAKMPDYVPQ